MSQPRPHTYLVTTFALVSIATIFFTLDASAGALAPGLAPVQTAANNVMGFLQGPLARTAVIITFIFCGFMYVANKQAQHAQTMLRVAAGAVIVFFTPMIFNALLPNVGTSGAAI